MNQIRKPIDAPGKPTLREMVADTVGVQGTALMAPETVAAEIGVSVETLATWRSTGRVKLPFVRIGGRVVRYKPADVAALVEAGYQPGGKDEA